MRPVWVVGVALHSSTPNTVSPHLVATLSAKNVRCIGSHRPIGILESLADRNVADSAVSSDLSPDSAVTPMAVPPWFQITFLCEACAGAATVSPNSRVLRKLIPYVPAEGDSVLVARFLSNVQDDSEIHTAASLVILNTDQQRLRWDPTVLQSHSEYMATIQLAKRCYYSRLARLFAKRLLKRQLLHYQGTKPMDKQPLRKDSSGNTYPPSEDFKYTLLERSLGLTYSQILNMLIKNIHFVMHDLDAGYSSNSIGDGPTWITFTAELLDALVSVIPSDSACDITEGSLRDLGQLQAGPYRLLTTWNGASAEAFNSVLISYGHRCLLCSKLFVSQELDKDSSSIMCTECSSCCHGGHTRMGRQC